MTLQEQLIAEKKTRWLDVGSGGGPYDAGFLFSDILPVGYIDKSIRSRYNLLDIVNTPESKLQALGTFDLVRLQHTFEHFSFEDGLRALQNCAKLLKAGGIILISVPDLRVHIQKYLDDAYGRWPGFANWANNRIPPDAPASAYFSVFAHSMPFEPHKWCYDAEGLIYQLKAAKTFKDIRELRLEDPLASTPFTHNRPEEDVCVIARKK